MPLIISRVVTNAGSHPPVTVGNWAPSNVECVVNEDALELKVSYFDRPLSLSPSSPVYQ
jgi:hypothetical protein